MRPHDLFGFVANAALPAVTAWRYGAYALHPDAFPEDYSAGLWTLFIAQIPICMMFGAFAAVLYIEGPAWRRAVVYLGVILLVAAVAMVTQIGKPGGWDLAVALAPVLGWALIMQIVTLLFAGPEAPLARRRVEAIANDAVNLIVLTIFGGLAAVLLVVVAQDVVRRYTGEQIDLEWSSLAWIGSFYFGLRAWSAAYPFTADFEARDKGYFQRPWIDWLMRHLQRTPSSSND